MKKIVITSDKYSFCLEGFQKLITKYWKENNLEFTVLGFSEPNSELQPNFKFESFGSNFSDKTPWSEALIPYFENLKEDFFFLCFEDHYLIDHVKMNYFEQAEKIMNEDQTVSKIRVHPKYLGHSLNVYNDLFSLGHTWENTYYPTSLRPAIWRKEFFIELLKHPANIRTPHDFENYNNRLSWNKKVLVPNELFFSDLDAMRRGEPNEQTFHSGKVDMDYYYMNLREEDLLIFREMKERWQNL